MVASTARVGDAPLAPVTVVERSELAYTADGPTRGHAHIGFDDYPADGPGRLDYAPLLLFGEGQMRPGEGFGLHRHEGIENLLLVRRGRLRHTDSSGDTWVAGPGDVCLMSAGQGGEHAERVEGDEDVHALVIWLSSNAPDAACRFRRRHIGLESRRDRWAVLASGHPSDRPERPGRSALPLAADATLLATALTPGISLTHEVRPGRRAYLIALDGGVEVCGQGVGPGERVFVPGPGTLEVFARGGAGDVELVLVDMAAQR